MIGAQIVKTIVVLEEFIAKYILKSLMLDITTNREMKVYNLKKHIQKQG